ncbi:hypothetical protein EX349_24345 [Pseudomonas protegens]|nr:hypothetical protein [Pseudomonas protegens]NUE78349.1 hypothetical protein [Pseudomonas protegens]
MASATTKSRTPTPTTSPPAARCCCAPCSPPPRPSPSAKRRSRLAGEEVRKKCAAHGDAFAGKPAPTRASSAAGPGVHWRTFRTGYRLCTGWRSVWPWL